MLATGTNEAIFAYQAAITQVIDAGGRTIIPGLDDSHIHLIRGGLHYSTELRWDGVPSLADALRMLREQALRTPPPQWVRVVGGWSEYQFAERRLPTLDEINTVAADDAILEIQLTRLSSPLARAGNSGREKCYDPKFTENGRPWITSVSPLTNPPSRPII